MAGGESFSNRVLWHFISGTGVLRPKELITLELERNENKILCGLLYYRKPLCPRGEELTNKNVTGLQKDFALKLSAFLSLDEYQSYQLFCSFLAYDYRGSQQNLQQLLCSERHSQALILKIRDYYYTERLYLLHCIKQILSYWPDSEHPYKDEYAKFLNSLLKDNKLIKQILDQHEDVCDAALPSPEKNSPLLNDSRQCLIWAHQNLKEQCELLEILLVYYKDFETDVNGFVKLLERFKKQGFGRRQSYTSVLKETADGVIRRIGYLEILVLLESLDIENVYRCSQENGFDDHSILKSPAAFQKIDKAIQSLGRDVVHSPLLLCWTVIRHLYLGDEDTENATLTRKFGNVALKLQIFEFLAGMLDTEPFCGKTIIASLAHYVVYTLMFATLTAFDESTLGNTEVLYDVLTKLMKQQFVADDMWQKGLNEGLGGILQGSLIWFPLDFFPLVQFSTSLASASKNSAKRVLTIWRQLPRYTEYFDRNSVQDLCSTADNNVWQLIKEKMPYAVGDFRVPAGTFGQLLTSGSRFGIMVDDDSPVIQWEVGYNGWKLLECEIEELLQQISHGSGMVNPIQVDRVTAVVELLKAVMTSDPECMDQLSDITSLLYQLIQRFSGLPTPPLDLLAACVECLTCVGSRNPKEVWHNIRQTGLLPFLTENVDNLSEVLSGQGLSAGLYGSILVGAECPQGRYPFTLAFLGFISQLVQPLFKMEREDQLMASMLFVLREVFPVYHKWRFYNSSRREAIGQKCLEIFHKVLNFLSDKKKQPASSITRPHLQEVCVYSLLFTEAGRSLLEIMATGVDNVEVAIAQQGSTFEGGGIELIQLIQMSFSVLNRLLLLKPPNQPMSPVENALASQPADRQHQHIVATIAAYIYHRHNPRVPTLATLLLKRLALVCPMSILACLGKDAEPIRDMYLLRLQAVTEDLRLKMVILEFLSVCVETQPGLIEIFLNVQPADSTDPRKKDLSLGKTSCLQTVLDLMDAERQVSYQCPPDLLCACTDFIHSLWAGLRETAMSVLRARETFWPSLCAPLLRDLTKMGEEEEETQEMVALPYEKKAVAFVLKVLSQEVYTIPSNKVDNRLKKMLQELVKKNRLKYWSMYMQDCMKYEGEADDSPSEENLSDNPTLQLLVAWKNFLLTMAHFKIEELQIGDGLKELIMIDILEGLQAQFSGGLSILNIKLASIASALYFTLVKNWKSSVAVWTPMVRMMHSAVRETCTRNETLIPPVQIGILGAMASVLQHVRQEGSARLEQNAVTAVLPTICDVLLQSTRALPSPRELMTRQASSQGPAPMDQCATDVKVKLQMVSCCLLEELLLYINNTEVWLPVLQEHMILTTLLLSAEAYIKAKQGVQYVHTLFQLFLTIAKSEKGAEALSLGGLTQHTCLAMTALYQNGDMLPRGTTPSRPSKKKSSTTSLSWHGVYCLCVDLYSTALATLKYSFLEDTLNFLGAHQERLHQSLEMARLSLFEDALTEAEKTCGLIYQLSHYNREWRLHLPDTLNRLLMGTLYMSQTFISLLIRPRYLQLILDYQGGQKSDLKGRESTSPIPPMLQHQTSTDDIDQPSPQLLQVQQSMLTILGKALSALKQFTPDLCEILLDQSMDISEYEPFLGIGFITPAVDQSTAPTFGMLLSCVNVCMRLLTKMEPRVTSPHRSSEASTAIQQVPKHLVVYVCENALYLIMSQASRYLKDPNLSPRDKQLLKRELGAEMNSFLMGLQRYFRRGSPQSPGGSTTVLLSPRVPSPGGPVLSRSISQTAFSSSQEQAFFKLVQEFVKQVLR